MCRSQNSQTPKTGFLEALSNLQWCEFLPLLTIATGLCPNGIKVACKKIYVLFVSCGAVCAICAAKIRLTATKLKNKKNSLNYPVPLTSTDATKWAQWTTLSERTLKTNLKTGARLCVAFLKLF